MQYLDLIEIVGFMIILYLVWRYVRISKVFNLNYKDGALRPEQENSRALVYLFYKTNTKFLAFY